MRTIKEAEWRLNNTKWCANVVEYLPHLQYTIVCLEDAKHSQLAVFNIYIRDLCTFLNGRFSSTSNRFCNKRYVKVLLSECPNL